MPDIDDAAACQRLGEAAYLAGLAGIRAPSAAGTGDILAVFLNRLRPNAHIEPSGFDEWHTPPPKP